MKSKENSIVELVIDSDDNFKCLFYQDQYMRNIYKMFPELIMVDATYKLLDLKLPIYILLAVDGDGLSEIVALFIVAEETEPVICSAVEAFKKHNSDWEKTCVVMSDKDFNERQAFANCFPQASLLICLYHALRSFRREVTMEKMGITADERNRCLEIFTKLIYSRSSEE